MTEKHTATKKSSPAAPPNRAATPAHPAEKSAGAGHGSLDEAKQKAAEIAEQAKQRAAELAEQAQKTAAELAEKAREQAEAQLAVQKESVAEGLGGVAEALRQTGKQMRKQEQAVIPDYVEGAAEQIGVLSEYLRKRDVRELVSQLEAFARRHPAAYLGGAFALGAFGVRFLRSSGRQRSRAAGRRPGGEAAPKRAKRG